MSRPVRTAVRCAVLVLALLHPGLPRAAAPASQLPTPNTFQPRGDAAIADDGFGEQVRRGKRIFDDTGRQAPQFVGNALRCANCHLDSGRQANAAPLWAAYGLYPQYRAKNRHVNTFQERLAECFRYSMNGKQPPPGDPVLVALESYAYFLAQGAPVGAKLPGQGFPKLPAPAQPMSFERGQAIYQARCTVCHGPQGQGQVAAGKVVFPPLWGPRSYNWGAGMADIHNAAGFIKANMPLGQGGLLSDQEAWDVAAYIDSQPRPQDPRYQGSVAATRAAFHDVPDSMYGRTVNGVVLGGP
jgi:thiosulfate dehydrogenase